MSLTLRLTALSMRLAVKARTAIQNVARRLVVLRSEYALAIDAAERTALHRPRRDEIHRLSACLPECERRSGNTGAPAPDDHNKHRERSDPPRPVAALSIREPRRQGDEEPGHIAGLA